MNTKSTDAIYYGEIRKYAKDFMHDHAPQIYDEIVHGIKKGWGHDKITERIMNVLVFNDVIYAWCNDVFTQFLLTEAFDNPAADFIIENSEEEDVGGDLSTDDPVYIEERYHMALTCFMGDLRREVKKLTSRLATTTLKNPTNFSRGRCQ